MLYPKNQETALEPELFRNPTSEYRGAPFWAWNGKLDREVLEEQIGFFQEMGQGGFHMHVRTGLQDPYLSPAFMDAVRFCVAEAEKRGMKAYLYDEDRWPSGSAGGRVTADHPEFARRMLLFTSVPYAPDRPNRAKGSEPGRGQNPMRHENGELLAVYDILRDGAGDLLSWKRTAQDSPAAPGATRWYAYLEHSTDDPWFNDRAYVDTLNPDAIRLFLDITHEAYAREVGASFGGVIPSIFTDEPQFCPKEVLPFAAEEGADAVLPWTEKLPELFRERYGRELMDALPELFWERADGELPAVRWQFQNLVTDRFVECYASQIGRWCEEHGLKLTGHVMDEDTLRSQTGAVGSAMRCYGAFGIPGIDNLRDEHQFNTAKQTQSRVRQLGREGMLSELYGVTGWDYDFRGYKLQGDWQAALGVTLRVPHLTWMSMRGEAKRDYPACIGHQSPWYAKFSLIEDHFARVNTALTRGRALCEVAMIHPIESYWLISGPNDRTWEKRERMDRRFAGTAETLLLSQLDFDYLEEACLASDPCGVREEEGCAVLQVGQMRYKAVVIPRVLTLRRTTVALLLAFARAGGAVFTQGPCPEYLDAEKGRSAELRELYERAAAVGDDPGELPEALEPWRFAEVLRPEGIRSKDILIQHRADTDCEWLFLALGRYPESHDKDLAPELRVRLRGSYRVTEYDTLTGEIRPLPAVRKNGRTEIKRTWHIHDSLLLKLEKTEDHETSSATDFLFAEESLSRSFRSEEEIRFGSVPISLSEPNALLLDEAEWQLNGGPRRPVEELLRLDNQARTELGIPLRRKEVVQPYALPPEEPKDSLTLFFPLDAEVLLDGLCLALEDAAHTRIRLNGAEVPAVPNGWYVDRCLEKVALPALPAGRSELELTVPVGVRTNLEYFYLLGEFSVRLRGTDRVLGPKVTELGFGDVTRQGLPYYTGNVDYELRVTADGPFEVRVPRYRGALCEVLLDGEPAGLIAFSPYRLTVGTEELRGEHRVTVRLYGNRQNGFAQLHHLPGVRFYQSPTSWRSDGDLWGYEYELKPLGLLRSPEIRGAHLLQADGSVRRAGTEARIREKS